MPSTLTAIPLLILIVTRVSDDVLRFPYDKPAFVGMRNDTVTSFVQVRVESVPQTPLSTIMLRNEIKYGIKNPKRVKFNFNCWRFKSNCCKRNQSQR